MYTKGSQVKNNLRIKPTVLDSTKFDRQLSEQKKNKILNPSSASNKKLMILDCQIAMTTDDVDI